MPTNRFHAFRMGLLDGWRGTDRAFVAEPLNAAYTRGHRLTAALAFWRPK